VPRFGTVSASGDLAPLSHIALALCGGGEVFYKGKRQAAKRAIQAAKLKPLVLEEKEGLALNNGSQYSNALGILCAQKLRLLLETYYVTTALSAQVMLGSTEPFREDLHRLRAHPGQVQAARMIMRFLSKSPIAAAHRDYDIDGEIQDPYNLRCAPQILGPCEEMLQEAEKTFLIEANSATDNPLIIGTEIISGGHFHGMPLAVRIFNLLQATAIIARLSNMRVARAVDENRNKGLGSDLMWPRLSEEAQSTSSALMIAEYVAASLTNYIWGQCLPNHLLSISTDAGLEDFTSMAANVALKLWDVLPLLSKLIAIELVFISQAEAIRKAHGYIPSKIPGKSCKSCGAVEKQFFKFSPKELSLNKAGEAVVKQVRRFFPLVKGDRFMANELEALAAEVEAGNILAAAR
jgi:histidine ammonia-lyase